MFEDKKYDVLIIDVNNVFTQQYCGNDYRRDDNTDLSGVYGTLKMIQFQIYKYEPSFVICVFDGKGGSHKKRKLFPNYKHNKGLPIKVNYAHNALLTDDVVKKSQENYIYQLRLLNEFLAYLPVHRLVAQGYEADEIIAYVANNYFKEQNKLIISNDKDFHQLVTPQVQIYDNKKREIKGFEFLKEFWGTENTHLITILRSIIGDSSDKIGGIDGLKLKGIQKYFPDLFERFDINCVDEFEWYLLDKIETCKVNKKQFASNWQTILKKANHLISGSNEDGTKCMDIIRRNYELMQLFKPDISIETVLLLKRYIEEAKPRFNSTQYKIKILQEGLRIEGSSTDNWEKQYRNLEYNQKQFKW